MDATSQQTVAQAVAAATQQQLNQSLHSPIPQPSIQSSTVDNLTCQWQGCGERCDSAELLYDHVCERHVGRKSTNNLNLTCQWGACRTATVKRDHITSHIRVHVPLKPHKCDFCGKAFKRPQDLKKHVKTHADDSVLVSSPSGGNSARGSIGGANGMGQQNGKSMFPSTYPMPASGVSDSSVSTASGYYPASHDHHMGNPYSTYQAPLGSNSHNGGSYPQAAPVQYAGYGSVSYPNNTQDIQSMDTRRRAIEALNDFLGDIKRRALDPHSYVDVSQRLQSNNLPLPVSGGYNQGYSNNTGSYQGYTAASLLDAFNQTGNGAGGNQGGLATQGYSLPLPNARTKNDLQDIDRFLEQLQATVYESSNQAAAAGVLQPGTHTMHTNDYGMSNHYGRSSHSPTNYGGSQAMTGVSMTGSSASLDTPVLTPASASSYTSSGHSPTSQHSRASIGSNQMYPSLPSVTGMSDLGAGYPTTTSAPASSLASDFHGLDGRRYSGGRLQRQAPSEDTEMLDPEDGAQTPKASDAKRATGGNVSSIDPALRGEDDKASPSSVSTPVEEKRQEEWIENIRIIEALKKWVEGRLQAGDYEDEGQAKDEVVDSAQIAKLVEEKMAHALAGAVNYPSLPSN